MKNYFCFIVIILFLYLVFHVLSGRGTFNFGFWVITLFILIVAYTYTIIRKLNYNFKKLVNYYALSASTLIVVLCIMYLPRLSFLIIHLIPVPLAVYMVNNIKTSLKSTLAIIFIFILFSILKNTMETPVIPIPPIEVSFIPQLSDTIYHILPVVTATYTAILISYYINEFTIIQHLPEGMEYMSDGEMQGKEVHNYPEKREINTKFDNLYDDILDYFDEKKPYQDPDFNIYQLAEVLNTNRTYISRALNKNGNTNFQTFVNKYRIQQIKEDIDSRLYDKFTLNHIAMRAGFRHQTTFNFVFKQIIGCPPSIYVKLLNENNQ